MHSNVTPSELGIGKMGENRAKGTVELKLKKQYVVNKKLRRFVLPLRLLMMLGLLEV